MAGGRCAPFMTRHTARLYAPTPARPLTSAAGRVRRSLVFSTLEAIVSEWVPACAGGAALTAWALHLGAGSTAVAALAALPSLAEVCQLPAAWITARLGARRVALGASIAARQPYLALAATPWLPFGIAGRRAVLFVVA